MDHSGEIEPAMYESLVIVGLNGESLELNNVPVTTTVTRLRDTVREHFGYSSLNSYVVNLLRDDGVFILISDQSLQDAGVRSGDRLQVLPPIEGGGPEWAEVERFLELAAASGVTGNVSFYLLARTLESIRTRWRKLREAKHYRRERKILDNESAATEIASPEVLTLEQDEAVRIAESCVCLKFDINPRALKTLSARHDVATSHNADEWTILLRSDAVDILGNMYVRVKVPSAEPEQAQILIVPPWVNPAG